MRDYSVHAVESRPARLGDTLIVTSFHGTPTRGFAAKEQPAVLVCACFQGPNPHSTMVKYSCNGFFARREYGWIRHAGFSVARFCKIDALASDPYFDALSFPDGTTILVNKLLEQQAVAGREDNQYARLAWFASKADPLGLSPY